MYVLLLIAAMVTTQTSTPAPSTGTPAPVPLVSENVAVIEAVAPVYPEDALRPHLHGDVVVAVSISDSGRVSTATLFKSAHLLFDRAAIKAASAWRFAPGPSGRVLHLTFRFVLDGDDTSFIAPYTVQIRRTPRVFSQSQSPI